MEGSSPNAFSNLLWQVQRRLRKNSMILPGVLLLVGCVLVLREHMFSDRKDLRTFLTLVLATMVPLAYIDTKISSQSDPLGLLRSFGAKVLLMHASFLLFRFRLFWYTDVFYLNLLNVAGFVGSVLAVLVGFWSSLGTAVLRDVSILVALSLGAATATEIATWGLHLAKTFRRELVLEIAGTSAEYCEILAFVPAVWTIFWAEKKDTAPSKATGETRLMATAFFAFLVGFYFFEDVVAAASNGREDTMASVAHLAHFLLLGDMTAYLLAHAADPERAKGTLLQRFSEACFSDCCV